MISLMLCAIVFALLFLEVNHLEQIWWKKYWTATQTNSQTMHYLSTQKGGSQLITSG